MKNRIIVFILVMFALTANCHIIIASHTPFKYPFSQGDSKWNEFSSPQDRVAALQIPNNSLAFLSTEDLLLISLDYPYLLDVFAFDDMDTGIKAVASKFNGFHEYTIGNPNVMLYDSFIVPNGRTFRVTGSVMCIGKSKITVQSGGCLIIDGGVFANAEIILSYNATVKIKNGGTLYTRPGCDFYAPSGCIVEVEKGSINGPYKKIPSQ